MSSVRTLASASALTRQILPSSCPHARRLLHSTAARRAVTTLEMPAMSPTMTEGGIASWKKKEGETFTAGDVLLEIETDKATIDVEAQDDGVMGKIILPDGSKNVPVGKIIALLAEEGDDISNLEVPKEEPKPKAAAAATPSPSPPAQEPAKPAPEPSSPKPAHGHAPSHSRPLFPSVLRLLAEHNVADPSEIKGTGVRGMLTKGDVLTFLGKASGPTGTFKESPSPIEQATKDLVKKEVAPPPLDGPAIRRLIVSSMLKSSINAMKVPAPAVAPDFDSIIADYLPSAPKPASKAPSVSASKPKSDSFLDGLF